MPDTIRQQIISQIITDMRRITVVNGYQTNVGNTVSDFELNWQEDELPAMSVCDTGAVPSPDVETESHHFLVMTVQIRVGVAADTRASECRKMIGDILQAVRSNERWSDGTSNLALQTDFAGDEFVLHEESFHIAAVQVTLNILYVTKRFNAYERD